MEAQRNQVNNIIKDIINSQNFPLLIKYSASQIYVCQDVKNSNLYDTDFLQAFYEELKKTINEDGAFTRFITLYSMYYYLFATL